jgi:tRNA1(Val) A37 N6-methylase TrmN6
MAGASAGAGFGALPGETVDDLGLFGLAILQKRDGYRFGLDSVLLANYARARAGDAVVELCSGSGVVSTLIAAKTRAATVTGVELLAPLVEMANRSAVANGRSRRVRFLQGDVRAIQGLLPKGSARVVVANPPYVRVARGRAGGGPGGAGGTGGGRGGTGAAWGQAVARHELACTVGDVAEAAAYLLGEGGALYLVQRPDRLVDAFCAMRAAGVEPKEFVTVQGAPASPPSIALVRGRKGGAPGLWVPAPICLQQGQRAP